MAATMTAKATAGSTGESVSSPADIGCDCGEHETAKVWCRRHGRFEGREVMQVANDRRVVLGSSALAHANPRCKRTQLIGSGFHDIDARELRYFWRFLLRRCNQRPDRLPDRCHGRRAERHLDPDMRPQALPPPELRAVAKIGGEEAALRRVFASTTSAPAYAYDPYGQPLQATAPITDFNYAGMFYNADSGLYLTRYRVYDPVGGRWLSRDPVGERSDPVANLYRYADGNSISFADPSGKQGPWGAAIGAAAGGFAGWASAAAQGGGGWSQFIGAATGALAGGFTGAVNASPAVTAAVGAGTAGLADALGQEANTGFATPPGSLNYGEIGGAVMLGAGGGYVGGLAGAAGFSPAASGMIGAGAAVPLFPLPNIGQSIYGPDNGATNSPSDPGNGLYGPSGLPGPNDTGSPSTPPSAECL